MTSRCGGERSAQDFSAPPLTRLTKTGSATKGVSYTASFRHRFGAGSTGLTEGKCCSRSLLGLFSSIMVLEYTVYHENN